MRPFFQFHFNFFRSFEPKNWAYNSLEQTIIESFEENSVCEITFHSFV